MEAIIIIIIINCKWVFTRWQWYNNKTTDKIQAYYNKTAYNINTRQQTITQDNRQYIPSKHHLTLNALEGVISKKIKHCKLWLSYIQLNSAVYLLSCTILTRGRAFSCYWYNLYFPKPGNSWPQSSGHCHFACIVHDFGLNSVLISSFTIFPYSPPVLISCVPVFPYSPRVLTSCVTIFLY
jgi:hypothetical protein